MDVFARIQELLTSSEVAFKTFEHREVFTSQEAADVRPDATLEQGAKALIMFGDKTPLMIVLPGNRRVATREFKNAFGVKDLRMATPEEVKELTGVGIGAVPPLGNIFGLPVYLDTTLGNHEMIFFNPGRHDRSITMKYTDLIKIVDPKQGSFSTSHEEKEK